jgi:hypothetical protein
MKAWRHNETYSLSDGVNVPSLDAVFFSTKGEGSRPSALYSTKGIEMNKEYKDRQNKPLVNPSFTLGDYETTKLMEELFQYDIERFIESVS